MRINRIAAWGISIALLIAGAGAAYWYVTVPLKQQRWERWHNYNVEQVQKALAGQETLRIGDAPDEQTKPLQARYEVGLKKARIAHNAWEELQKQSKYTAKVLGVTVQVLKAGNEVGLDALREPLRDIFSEQSTLSRHYESSHTGLKEVRQQLRVDWRKLWPDNELEFEIKTPVATMSAEERKQAEAVLADLLELENANYAKYDAIVAARIPNKDGTGSNLTPYEEEKYQVAWARKLLYERLHIALDQAYRALGGPTEDADAALVRKQVAEMDEISQKIEETLESVKRKKPALDKELEDLNKEYSK